MICLFIHRTNSQNSVKRCWSTTHQMLCENIVKIQPETVRLLLSYPGLQDDTEWINVSVLRLTSAISLRDRSCAKGQTKQNKKSWKSLLTTRELEQSS